MIVDVVWYVTFSDSRRTPPIPKESPISLTLCQLLEFANTSIGFLTLFDNHENYLIKEGSLSSVEEKMTSAT